MFFRQYCAKRVAALPNAIRDALAATLVYRAAGTLLPALVGGLAIVALRPHRGNLPRVAAEGTP
jgi:hypothetical protein